jgi:hypothetical protein
MSGLEVASRPILEMLWDGVSPRFLDRETCDTLARWTFKTAACLNYACDYKRIIPLKHLHWFYDTGRLPDNSTVDLAFCPADGLHWVIGGNKGLCLLTTDLLESLRPSYHVTIQIEALLLRLAWTPLETVSVHHFGDEYSCRIFPLRQFSKEVTITRRFRDRWQFHFTGTMFAEDGVYPNNQIDLLDLLAD